MRQPLVYITREAIPDVLVGILSQMQLVVRLSDTMLSGTDHKLKVKTPLKGRAYYIKHKKNLLQINLDNITL